MAEAAKELAGVSVVVPVKDEAGNVAPLAREIATALAQEPLMEIIFVDDGSSDTTVAELVALRPALPVRVLSHAKNLGQSRAMRTGVRAARSQLVVTLDGDGQNDPADIPKLIALYRESEADPHFAMVAGERVKRQDSWSKRAASRFANRIRRAALGDTANDTGCSLKAFRRDAYLSLPYFDHMHRYLITLMQREGYEVRFVRVGHRPRGSGRSKYGNWDRALAGIYDLFGVRWLKRRFRGPSDIKEL
jgi:glycosyltransferase involved in cell wall biosynthesis